MMPQSFADVVKLLEPHTFAGFIAALYVMLRSVQKELITRLAWTLLAFIAAPFAAMAYADHFKTFGIGEVLGALSFAVLYELLYRPDFVIRIYQLLRGKNANSN